MVSAGSRRDEQRLGDLAVRLPEHEELENVELSAGELCRILSRALVWPSGKAGLPARAQTLGNPGQVRSGVECLQPLEGCTHALDRSFGGHRPRLLQWIPKLFPELGRTSELTVELQAVGAGHFECWIGHATSTLEPECQNAIPPRISGHR